MELEQRGRLDNDGQFRNPVGPDEQGSQPEHQAIKGGEVRGPLSGAIADQQLVLERQRFRGHRADATRAEEFRKRDKQVNRQEEQIGHERNAILFATLRKTTRHVRTGISESAMNRCVLVSLSRLCMQPHAQCARYLQNCREAWIAVLAERLVQTFSTESRVSRNL